MVLLQSIDHWFAKEMPFLQAGSEGNSDRALSVVGMNFNCDFESRRSCSSRRYLRPNIRQSMRKFLREFGERALEVAGGPWCSEWPGGSVQFRIMIDAVTISSHWSVSSRRDVSWCC